MRKASTYQLQMRLSSQLGESRPTPMIVPRRVLRMMPRTATRSVLRMPTQIARAYVLAGEYSIMVSPISNPASRSR